MKRILYLFTMALIAIPITLFGCQPTPPEPTGSEMEIRLAPIHEIRVNIAESFPQQIFVYIKGGLADGCTTFHETTTERSGNTIDIRVTTKRPKDAICTQVYGFFEENEPLGTEFTMGETYIINVNDQTTSFLMQ